MKNAHERKHLKYLKWQLVLAGLLFWGGVVWIFVGLIELGRSDSDAGSELIPQAVVCAVGFIWYLLVRVRFWMLNE